MLIIKHKKRIFLFFVYFAASVFLFTCGIEDIYFLPQVPQTNITTISNTSATIVLPSLSSYYYANNYIIYYRIYISDRPESGTINTSSIRSAISPSLESDFNAIFPNTDPTNTTSGISADILFSSRSYFELALEGVDINNLLSISGGNIEISFPTAYLGNPELIFNNVPPPPDYYLKRSYKLITPLPSNKYFQNTDDLSNFNNAGSNNNADVAARNGIQGFAYASMYVVAAGIDPVKFTPVYSKPTHINIFRLPDAN